MYFIENINIVPKFTEIDRISDINLLTKISKNINIHMPIIFLDYSKANNFQEIINYSINGTFYFIHHKCEIDEQINIVKKVKSYLNYIIFEPFTIRPNVNVKNIKNTMDEKNIGCLLVSNTNNQLLGIITRRDVNYSFFLNNCNELKISDIMTPFEKIVSTK